MSFRTLVSFWVVVTCSLWVGCVVGKFVVGFTFVVDGGAWKKYNYNMGKENDTRISIAQIVLNLAYTS